MCIHLVISKFTNSKYTQLGIERTNAHRMEGYFVLTVFIFNSHLHGQKKNMRNILLIDNTLHQSIWQIFYELPFLHNIPTGAGLFEPYQGPGLPGILRFPTEDPWMDIEWPTANSRSWVIKGLPCFCPKEITETQASFVFFLLLEFPFWPYTYYSNYKQTRLYYHLPHLSGANINQYRITTKYTSILLISWGTRERFRFIIFIMLYPFWSLEFGTSPSLTLNCYYGSSSHLSCHVSNQTPCAYCSECYIQIMRNTTWSRKQWRHCFQNAVKNKCSTYYIQPVVIHSR